MTKQRPPVKKNDIVTLEIDDLTHDGNGVGKVDSYPIFTPNILPGERADIRVVKANKRFGYGRLDALKKQSKDRVSPPCDVYYKCGGCQLQHMSYDLQLEMKENQVKNVMRKIAHIDDSIVHPVLGMDNPWNYRNKIQMPVGEKDGELITGFYQQRSHRIIDDMKTCIIQDKRGDEVVEAVRQIATELGIDAYDERAHKGTLRHIIVRTTVNNRIMLILVTKGKKLANKEELIEQVTEKFPDVTSIIQNINKDKTNVILGKEMLTLYGDDYIIDSIGDLQFKISPRSFFQVNPEQTKVLYDTALDYANVSEKDTVIDAYCGIGTISLFLSKKAKKVYGVEIVPEAIENAKENARLNKIDNAEFIVGKAEDVMQKWQKQGLKPNVIVVDPPRKGCDESFLQAMLAMKPDRIVYVSCNPSTLARDLKILEDGGYKTMKIQPVDMFAQTSHVECVALMSRVEE